MLIRTHVYRHMFINAHMRSIEEKNPQRQITEEKTRCFRPPNPPKTSYGRHWGVVRRAKLATGMGMESP